MEGCLLVILTTTQGFITNLCSIWFSKICGWPDFPSMHWIQEYCRTTAAFSCGKPEKRGKQMKDAITLQWLWVLQGFDARWQCYYNLKSHYTGKIPFYDIICHVLKLFNCFPEFSGIDMNKIKQDIPRLLRKIMSLLVRRRTLMMGVMNSSRKLCRNSDGQLWWMKLMSRPLMWEPSWSWKNHRDTYNGVMTM